MSGKERKPYLQVRRKTYRGQAGWLVCGSFGGIFGTSIFTLTRSSAEHIRRKVLNGEDTTMADFEPQAEYAYLDVQS